MYGNVLAQAASQNRASAAIVTPIKEGSCEKLRRASRQLPRLCRSSKDWEMPETTKEVVGIHVLVTHSLFASDIPRRFLPRVSQQRNRLLLLGRTDGFTEGSLNLGIICTQAVRNTPANRYNSALHQRPSNLSASASASLIASQLGTPPFCVRTPDTMRGT
jgi:hypothetical protein